jgi:hypothetical protein
VERALRIAVREAFFLWISSSEIVSMRSSIALVGAVISASFSSAPVAVLSRGASIGCRKLFGFEELLFDSGVVGQR